MIIALFIAVLGFVGAPVFLDWNVPGLSGAARSNGITGVRQAALLVAGGIIAAATLLQTVERDRFTRDKYEEDIEDAKKRFVDLSKQREIEQTQYKEQRKLDRERLTQQRTFDTEKELRARFVTAAGLLTGDRPVSRTAGAYAMAALADEWGRSENHTERQVYIDILCAYLRSPWNLQTEESDEEALVRSNIISIIADHLRPTATVNWQQATFNLARAQIAFDSDLSGIEVQPGTILSFEGSTFSRGTISFGGATFTGGTTDFSHAEFTGGTTDFSRAKFTGGTTDFSHAKFTGGTTDFRRADLTGGTIAFKRALFAGRKTNFSNANFSGGTAEFGRANFTGGTTDFIETVFSGSVTNFGGTKFTGGTTYFVGAHFIGGITDFIDAEFNGGFTYFSDAEFNGGFTNFSRAHFIGGLTEFVDAKFTTDSTDFTDAHFGDGTTDFTGVTGPTPEST
jgi:uncharacterized protein YjbI with pentapeptide repeats